MLKAIFFDAAGTLIYLPRPVGEHYRNVAERHGLHLNADVLDRAFRAAWQTMPSRAPVAMHRPDDDRAWWRRLVNKVLDLAANGNISPQTREDYFQALFEHFRDHAIWAVYPEARFVLADLAKSFRLAVVSNFDSRLRDILAGHRLSSYFSEIILSSEVGAEKPHAAIFQTALSRFDLEPHEAMHVGDDPVLDWNGAASAGLEVFRLGRPANSLTDLLSLVKMRTV